MFLYTQRMLCGDHAERVATTEGKTGLVERVIRTAIERAAEVSGTIQSREPAVLSLKDVDLVQDIAEMVYVAAAVKKYIADIVIATREPHKYLGRELAGYIRIGASPRASINFLRASKASALIRGRTYATPEDVRTMCKQILRHRIGLNYAAVADNVSVEEIIERLVKVVPAP